MKFALAVAALSPIAHGSSSCKQSQGRVLGEGNIGRVNGVSSADGCCGHCSQNAGCQSWTWRGPGYGSAPNSCWLKDNTADKGSAGSDTTSGLRDGSAPTPSPPNLTDGLGCVPPNDGFSFCNLSLPVHDRILDLISRIDDADKANLLTARGKGGTQLQSFPELGVPAYYWGTNCLHSMNSGSCVTDSKGKQRCPINFPSGPSFGALFDRGMIHDMGDAIGKELRAMFALRASNEKSNSLDCWGPVINLNRDPRWGRNGEGGLEDAYAMGELAKAWTLGFQSPRPSKLDKNRMLLQGILTLKHQAANSVENTVPFNRHNFDANATYGVDPYVMQDYYQRPFRTAIREGGARGVMCSYNAVLGVPTCLSGVMRDSRVQWGFEGYVTSDSDSVANAYHNHHYVSTGEDATALALKDGQCDINSGDTYNDHLINAVKRRSLGVTQEDVDRAVYNSLKQRFDLGLFDPPEAYDWPSADDVGTDASWELTLRASQSSIVLLRNDLNLLPLKPGQRIAVIGPHAKAQKVLVEPYAFKPVCPADASGDAWSCVTTPYDAIRGFNNAAGGSTTTAAGCDLFDLSESGFDEALKLAEAADVVVLGIGIETCGLDKTHNVNPKRPGRCYQEGPSSDYVFPDEYLELEAHDRLNIDLPPVQHSLAAKVLALGKPTVLFLMNAGAVAIDAEAAHQGSETAPLAIVEAFYPGPRGAEALAQGLFGEHNRWGRLPYTIYPKSFQNDASMLEHDLRASPGRTYRYYPNALFSFGHGLSLTSWSLESPSKPTCLTVMATASPQKPCRVSVRLTNTGSRMGDSVVLAYLQRADWAQASTTRSDGAKLMPQQKALFDFQRLVDVEAGGALTVDFDITPESLMQADEDTGNLIIKPGKLQLVFEDGTGASVTMDAEIIGDKVVLEKFPDVPAPPPPSPPTVLDTLLAGDKLIRGSHLVSASGTVRLEMQGDGNLVLYEDQHLVIGDKTVVLWASGTSGNPDAHAGLQSSDGNFIVRDSNGSSLWASGAHPGTAKMVVQDDCNLIKFDGSGSKLWSLGTSCGSMAVV